MTQLYISFESSLNWREAAMGHSNPTEASSKGIHFEPFVFQRKESSFLCYLEGRVQAL